MGRPQTPTRQSAGTENELDRAVDPRAIPVWRWSAAMTFTPVVIAASVFVIGATVARSPAAIVLSIGWTLLLAAVAAYVWKYPPARHRHLRYRIDDVGITIRDGVFWRTWSALPRVRIQHTDVSQGPLQRRYGVADAQAVHGGQPFHVHRLAGTRACRGTRVARPSCSGTPTTMPSDEPATARWHGFKPDLRLHPDSWVFNAVAQIRALFVPLIVAAIVGSRRDFSLWVPAILLVPMVGVALWRQWIYRYGFSPDGLVIHEGLFFRNVRTIDYARIENVDTERGLLHRLLNVADVRVETSTGGSAEARIRVLGLDAVEDMRTRIFARRAERPTPAPTSRPRRREPGRSAPSTAKRRCSCSARASSCASVSSTTAE